MKRSITHPPVLLAILILFTGALLSGCMYRSNAGLGNSTYGEEENDADGQSDSAADPESSDSLAGGDDQPDDIAKKGNSDELDWPFWRGPEYNGISRETGLPDTWNPKGGEGSNVVWNRDDLGGRSTPIVMNGRLYMLVRDKPGTDQEGEKVVCLNVDDGKTIWENPFNVWSSDVPDTRVAWSAVLGDPETGNVYALGVCDYFQCIDGATGETKWGFPLHEKFGFLSTYGGRTNFPVICEDLVIVSAVDIGWGDMAKPAHRFVAFNKHNGEVVWFNGTRLLPYDTTYSAPTVTVLNGQKALVFGSGDGAVWAIQPRTGRHIWKYQLSRKGLDCSPVVVGDAVFSGHSLENTSGSNMGAVARIDGSLTGNITKKGEVWKVEEVMAGKSSPVVVDGVVYAGDDFGKLYALDAESGKQIGRRQSLGSAIRSSLLYADGKIYAMERSGRWYILKPHKEKGVEIIARGRLPSGDEFLATPIVSHGRMYIQTTGGLYCLEDKSKKHGVTPRPAAAEETVVEEDQEPAHVQVVPAEVLTRPNDFLGFRARVYNSRGQLIEDDAKAEWVLEGEGQLQQDGAFLAPDGKHQAVFIKAKVGDLVGQSRVRVVPDLPWSFNFDELEQPPITWVGARYRHVIREVDGSKAMVKVTTIPKGTRSRCWFGHPDLSDYTIQAEVKGAVADKKMPDIGLIAQGYTLDLQGQNQKLQIRSWVSHDERTQKTIEFPWQPDKWYMMKLRAAVEDDKAVVKGKVWPKGEEEPTEWTIEFTDARPIREGSPGLRGDATNAEMFLDNISVTANE